MINAVNTQALASSLSAGRAERPDADQAFKALDSGNKGYLTADDLQAVVVKISAEGAKRADAGAGAAAPTAPSAQQVLARLDGDGDGKVTQQEFKAAQPKSPPSSGSAGSGVGSTASRGAPPAGGQAPAGGGGGNAGATSASSASSTKTYEPADTNEDGAISPLEQQAYDAKLTAEKAEQAAQEAQGAQKAGSGRSSEAGAAVKAYGSVEQLGTAG
jgi:hypothetical protein